MSTFDSPILHKVLIRAERKRVFDAMTTAHGLDAWFTRGSSVDLRPGGTLIFRWREWGPDAFTGEARCPIVAVEVPRRFVFKWWEDHYTTVEMDFGEVNGGTLVRLTEYGYEDSAEGHRRLIECATGWGEALTLLKFFCEYGVTY
jgi:uncharacterized protein YndB with AHSA1/START domain